MSLIRLLPLLIGAMILMLAGIQSIFHYFHIRRSGVDVGIDRYQLDNFEKVYKGKDAQIRALRSLFVGTFFITVGGGFIVGLLLIFVLD